MTALRTIATRERAGKTVSSSRARTTRAAVVVGVALALALSAAEARADETKARGAFPRLVGGGRIAIGGLAYGRGGPYGALSVRVGARLGPVLSLYGETSAGAAFFGPTTGASAVGALVPQGALLVSLRPARSFEIAAGPVLGAIASLGGGGDTFVRAGGLVRALFPFARRDGGEGGVHFAPSFEIVVLGGPSGPSVALSAGVVGLEWY